MINPILKSIDTIPMMHHFDEKYYHLHQRQHHHQQEQKAPKGYNNTICPPIKYNEKELIRLNPENFVTIQPTTKTKTKRATKVTNTINVPLSFSSQSQSRPIITSKTEQFHRYCDLIDTIEDEKLYTNATWRMYHRIIKYRNHHPLPEMYYNDNNDNNNSIDHCINSNNHVDDSDYNDFVPTTETIISDSDQHFRTFLGRKYNHDHSSDHHSPIELLNMLHEYDHSEDTTEHCMMFELDL
jgi:hypothetical protein